MADINSVWPLSLVGEIDREFFFISLCVDVTFDGGFSAKLGCLWRGAVVDRVRVGDSHAEDCDPLGFGGGQNKKFPFSLSL